MAKVAGLLLGVATVCLAQTTQTTQMDVQQNLCKPVTLIFARGTTEQGNMGSVVGPVLATAMKQALGDSNVAVQGVNYPADIAGAISGATAPKQAQGAKNMAMLAMQAVQQCPTTKVVLSGYSQGAEQVRGALMNLPQNMVMAAVTFGDPLQNQPFMNIPQANTKINCDPMDAVCQMKFQISAAHLSYGMNGNVPQSVSFVQNLLGNSTTASVAGTTGSTNSTGTLNSSGNRNSTGTIGAGTLANSTSTSGSITNSTSTSNQLGSTNSTATTNANGSRTGGTTTSSLASTTTTAKAAKGKKAKGKAKKAKKAKAKKAVVVRPPFKRAVLM